jgi:hypothetical protein
MSDGFLAIGYAVVAVVAAIFGVKCWDAYKYRHHYTESLKRKVIGWGSVLLAWLFVVAVATVVKA